MSRSAVPEPPLAWTIEPSESGDHARELRLEATVEERAAVAAALGLVECALLVVTCKVRPRSRSRYSVSGEIAARVTQSCVVSLEPVHQTIAAPVEVEIGPDPESVQPAQFDPLADVDYDVLDDRGRIPLGRIAYDYLAAALDPYPRASDAHFAPATDASSTAAPSPFAALARLKRPE